MKSILLFYALLLLCVQITYATKHLVEGYYIDLNDKKIDVIFEIKTYEEDQKVAISDIQEEIITYENNKKYKLLPLMAKLISFNYKEKNYTLYSKCLECLCLACPDTLQNNFFLIKKIAGKVSLYSIEESPNGKGIGADFIARTSMNNNPVKRYLTYILEKNNEKLVYFDINSIIFNYKLELLKYLDDCVPAQNKIRSKDFIYKQIVDLVNIYNEECK